MQPPSVVLRAQLHCEACTGVRGRPTIEIDHQPGDEIQWDFLELPCPWRPHTVLHVLVGTLAYSGRMRGAICAGEDEAQVVAGVASAGGHGSPLAVRRMSAVVLTGTGQVRQSFLEAAKFYGGEIAVCRPRRPNRKDNKSSAPGRGAEGAGDVRRPRPPPAPSVTRWE